MGSSWHRFCSGMVNTEGGHEMKLNRQPKLKAFLIATTFLVALHLGIAKQAHAYTLGGGEVIAAGIILTGIATYLLGKTIVCLPVAAVKASDNAEGFSGAYKSCWTWESSSRQTAQVEQQPVSEPKTSPTTSPVPEPEPPQIPSCRSSLGNSLANC